MTRPSSWKSTSAWCIVLVLGLIFAFGPPSLAEQIQKRALDAASFGLRWVGTWPVRATVDSRPAAASQATLDSLKRMNESLQLQVAQLRERLERVQDQSSYPLTSDLVQSELVPALVLGETGSLSPVGRQLVGLGAHHGLVGEELILEGTGQLLDQGKGQGLERDQLVVDGHAVAGRISRVGQWTSLFQPITSVEFRSSARLVRHSSSGPVFGPRGVLAGDGTHCRLEHVPAGEAVTVGDAVYCDDPSHNCSLILGRISGATLNPADPFWTIAVRPEASLRTRDVYVIKSTFNPQRLAEK